MNDLLNIATSLANDSLTLFVGTGFSRHLTDDSAPTWPELMAECAKAIDDRDKLFKELFKTRRDGSINPKFPILICSQILELRYKQENRSLKDEIVRIIKHRVNKTTINEDRLLKMKAFFRKHKNINIVTTNYDTLFSDFIMPKGRVIVEGNPIPRINTGQNIFHIHGSIKKPDSIVASFNDYFHFINSRNYFSRKFFTLLEETTVVIMGYSLEDFNLNAILNEVNTVRKESFRSTDILYVSRNELDPVIQEYYYSTYGIKTLQIPNLTNLFVRVENNFPRAKKLIKSVRQLKLVLKGKRSYEDDFLKLRSSLHDILQQADSLSIEGNNLAFLNLLVVLLEKKRSFSSANGAWEQYHHLADWLLEIASRIVIKGSAIEKQFNSLAEYSFENCSRKRLLGYSWQAYTEWNTRWKDMKFENQIMLRELISENSFHKPLEIDKIHIVNGEN
jgi:hypothetical protein